MYVIGKTGTGKSTLLRNMLVEDIVQGNGVGLIDPHGDLAADVLDAVPGNRTRDVLYFNPADAAYPIGFNPLHGAKGDQRYLVASAVVAALKNVWRDSWGPRLEYILYASVVALASIEGGTLLGVHRMVSDAGYRNWVVDQLDDSALQHFWKHDFAGFDKTLMAQSVAPIQNKVGQLIMSPSMRNVLGQTKNRINPRFIMDEGKILVADLAKGRLGEDKSSLLGSLLVSMFQHAAMGRADIPEHERRDWYLYVDEFQNFATDAFIGMLSEARKQRLCLTLAHQHGTQLRPEVRDAVLGNAGTVLAFRVSDADGDTLAREFGNRYSAAQFTDLGNFRCNVKLLQDGMYGEPFQATAHGRREQVIRRARHSLATPRGEVEARITRWVERHF